MLLALAHSYEQVPTDKLTFTIVSMTSNLGILTQTVYIEGDLH